MSNKFWCVGMMSGTSLDGIDVAAIETDGKKVFQKTEGVTYPYTPAFQEKIQNILGEITPTKETQVVEKELTELHAKAFEKYIKKIGFSKKDVDLIGFHGHTIMHRPPSRYKDPSTWQIGDGQLLREKTGVPVVYNMRTNDLAHGGEGAPLVPLYQKALTEGFDLPLAIINIGGISNVAWIGPENKVLAFDMGPGNSLLDQWVFQKTQKKFDEDGALARAGHVHDKILQNFMTHPYFFQKPPKSLDRLDFNLESVQELPTEDGAATLVGVTAQSIEKGTKFLPQKPQQYILTGGGRHNKHLVKRISDVLAPIPVKTAEALGWDGDFMEAEAFAYLAVRALKKYPLTLPTTTGVEKPISGGVLIS